MKGKMRSKYILAENLLNELLEEFNLSNFHGFFRIEMAKPIRLCRRSIA